MNKNIVIGAVALGGLLLVSTLVMSIPKDTNKVNQVKESQKEETASKTLSIEVTNRFPSYPNSTVSTQNTSTGKDGKIFYSFSLVTTSNIKDVNEWYRKALAQNGWSIKSDKNVAGYQIIQAENKNLYTSMQAANGPTPGTTLISQQAQVRP